MPELREGEALVQEARQWANAVSAWASEDKRFNEAADFIDSLVDALTVAHDALRPFAAIADSYDPATWRAGPSPMYAILDECRAARDALNFTPKHGEG